MMPKGLFKILFAILGSIVLGSLSGITPVNAKNLSAGGLDEPYESYFPPNDITNWNPSECTGGTLEGTCFKVDSSTDASAFWYPEGCLNNGTCSSGIYASTAFTSGYNSFLLSDTQTDEDFGGMQYIYAENYDIEFGGYEGWIAKFTPNGGSSTQKYYWIVLPDSAYSNGFGETFVATFENLSEPVYFIVYDTHQCVHQNADYCGKAEANPDGVEIGSEFLGAFTKQGGNTSTVEKIAGKLTGLCRLNGQGEILAHENGSSISTNGGSSSPLSSSEDGTNVTIIGDSITVYANEFYHAFNEKLPNADIYAKSSKSFNSDEPGNESGLTILSQLVSQGKLRRVLVFALGSNNGAAGTEVTQADIDRLLDLAKDCDKIILLTNYKSTNNSTYSSNNELFKKTADENNKVTLIDWKEEAGKDPDKYIANEGGFGVHPSEEGSKLWAELIYNAVIQSNLDTCGAPDNGDFASYVMKFAWTIDELSGMGVGEWQGTLTPKEGYKEAYDRRVSEGKYVGSMATYADCGGFVTTLMNESGYEPEYNYSGNGGNTLSQEQWLRENWELLGTSGGGFDTSQLQQGDVYINDGHTFVFVGEIDGFGSDIASASWDTRVPQASGDSASEANFHVYRKKGQ